MNTSAVSASAAKVAYEAFWLRVLANFRAVFVSIRKTRSRQNGRHPVGHYRIGRFQRQVREWQNSVRLAERGRKRYPDRYKIVRYETLVTRPGETLHDVCAFLGEADIPALLLAEGLRGFRNDSDQLKDTQISTDYIGCFRKLLSEREIAFIQVQTKQAMGIYNYDLEPVQLSLVDYVLLYFTDWPVYLARKLSGKVRSRLGIGASPGAVSPF